MSPPLTFDALLAEHDDCDWVCDDGLNATWSCGVSIEWTGTDGQMNRAHLAAVLLAHVREWLSSEGAAERLHDAYEDAAALNGWATQERSRVPWADVPIENKVTMLAALCALTEETR